MVAAEELGLKTGFNSTLGSLDIENKLNLEKKTAILALGIGYAFQEFRISRKVYENNLPLTPYPNSDIKIHDAAYNLLLQNKNFIKAEATAWIDYQVSNNIFPFINYKYDRQKCNRDLEYIISSFLHDLQFNENNATKQTIRNYWPNNKLSVRGYAEKSVYIYLENLIKHYILKNIQSPIFQSSIPQIINESIFVENNSINFIENLFVIIQEGLSGINLIKEVGFDYANTSPSIKTGMNRKDKPLFSDMIKYI